ELLGDNVRSSPMMRGKHDSPSKHYSRLFSLHPCVAPAKQGRTRYVSVHLQQTFRKGLRLMVINRHPSRWRRWLTLVGVAVFCLVSGEAASDESKAAERGSVKNDAEAIKQRIANEYSSLEKLYKHLHTHPELSLQEAASAARMAKELRAAGFEVTEKVGGY